MRLSTLTRRHAPKTLRSAVVLSAALALASGCRAKQAATGLKDVGAGNAAFATFATCSNGSYNGGWSLSVANSTTSAAAQLEIQRVKGPDGDGEETPLETVSGIWSNADERDPYQHIFRFQAYEVEITIERKDDRYPGRLKLPTGKVETLDCVMSGEAPKTAQAATKPAATPAAPAAKPASTGSKVVANCSNASGYYGGWAATISNGAGSAATLEIERVAGPDGDGDRVATQTVAGTWRNADERDPYQYDYQFAKLEALITLERRDDRYPMRLKGSLPDGTAIDETLDCSL